MPQSLPSIDIKLPEKLKDRGYRQRFFIAETSANIARQLVYLRKRRGLNQRELAELADMKQPRISQVEKADYLNWSFNTLRRLAEAMDARIRVLIEPSEDVLLEYSDERPSSDNTMEARAKDIDQSVALIPSQPQASHLGAGWKESDIYSVTKYFDDILTGEQQRGIESHRKQPGRIPSRRNKASRPNLLADRDASPSGKIPFPEIPNSGGVSRGRIPV